MNFRTHVETKHSAEKKIDNHNGIIAIKKIIIVTYLLLQPNY